MWKTSEWFFTRVSQWNYNVHVNVLSHNCHYHLIIISKIRKYMYLSDKEFFRGACNIPAWLWKCPSVWHTWCPHRPPAMCANTAACIIKRIPRNYHITPVPDVNVYGTNLQITSHPWSSHTSQPDACDQRTVLCSECQKLELSDMAIDLFTRHPLFCGTLSQFWSKTVLRFHHLIPVYLY